MTRILTKIKPGTALRVVDAIRANNQFVKGQIVVMEQYRENLLNEPCITISTYPDREPINNFWYLSRFELFKLPINKLTQTI